MICKELEVLCCEYNPEEVHMGSNGDIVIHYEHFVTLTKHMSGIIEVCFKLRTSRPNFSVEVQEDYNGNGLLGLYYYYPDYELGADNSELLEIEWKADNLGDLRDFRILTEQCKDEIVFVMVPWKMLGMRNS